MGFLFAILIGVILLIVYGSLYPWTFVARPLFASPLYLLLHTWEYDPLSRRYWADIPVNIGIYIPLGMSAYLAFRRTRLRFIAIVAPVAPVALGAVLSASIEMLQLYVPGRHCSTLDLAMNILGSALGVAAGLAFVAITDLPPNGPDFRVRDRNAVVLLFCWVGFLLFPLFPSFSIPELRDKIAVFAHGRLLAPGPLALSVAEWFAVGRLLAATGARSPLAWLAGLFAFIPVQFILVNHYPVLADFEGPFLAMLIFLLCRQARCADCVAGVALLIAAALRALAPFRLAAFPQPFLWIPFGGFLLNSWQTSVSILLGKLFQYGASVWLLSRSAVGLLGATVVVAVVLAAIEVVQTRMPGHVPEITDPLLAILLGLAFSVLRTHRAVCGVEKMNRQL
jgi:VanZ family protein